MRNMNEEYSVFDRVEDLIILLGIILVLILKITNVIKISWFWLLCPFWIAGIIIIVCLVVATISALICAIAGKIKEKSKNEWY